MTSRPFQARGVSSRFSMPLVKPVMAERSVQGLTASAVPMSIVDMMCASNGYALRAKCGDQTLKLVGVMAPVANGSCMQRLANLDRTCGTHHSFTTMKIQTVIL